VGGQSLLSFAPYSFALFKQLSNVGVVLLGGLLLLQQGPMVALSPALKLGQLGLVLFYLFIDFLERCRISINILFWNYAVQVFLQGGLQLLCFQGLPLCYAHQLRRRQLGLVYERGGGG